MSEANAVTEQFSGATDSALGAARRRFHALVVLEAVGKASAAERNKLDRYQALVREKPSREMVSLRAHQDWEHRRFMKKAGRVLRAAQTPNDPKLSDCGAGRGSCRGEGAKAAGKEQLP